MSGGFHLLTLRRRLADLGFAQAAAGKAPRTNGALSADERIDSGRTSDTSSLPGSSYRLGVSRKAAWLLLLASQSELEEEAASKILDVRNGGRLWCSLADPMAVPTEPFLGRRNIERLRPLNGPGTTPNCLRIMRRRRPIDLPDSAESDEKLEWSRKPRRPNIVVLRFELSRTCGTAVGVVVRTSLTGLAEGSHTAGRFRVTLECVKLKRRSRYLQQAKSRCSRTYKTGFMSLSTTYHLYADRNGGGDVPSRTQASSRSSDVQTCRTRSGAQTILTYVRP